MWDLTMFFLFKHLIGWLVPSPMTQMRTDQLLKGFKTELEGRMKSIEDARTKLETLFAKRIDDEKIDLPEHAGFKSECMQAIRTCESAFTSYSGSVRSIKAIVETCYV